MQTELNEALYLKPFADEYPNLCNESSLRWQVRNRKTNGLEASGAITKRTGKWLFFPRRYAAWLCGRDAASA